MELDRGRTERWERRGGSYQGRLSSKSFHPDVDCVGFAVLRTCCHLNYQLDAAVASILAPRELPDHLVLLSSTGELSLVSGNDLSITGSLPASTSAAPLFQSAQIYPVGQASSLLPSSLVNQIPSNSQAQLVILSRNFSITESSIQNAAAATSSLVELGKKKSKKSRRPSAVSVLEEAELEAQSRALSDLTTRTELEIVLLDVHVETEDGINVGIVSLGRVQVPGTHAVVSPEGFVSSLGGHSSSLFFAVVDFH